jgi:serine/threonine protein kinase
MWLEIGNRPTGAHFLRVIKVHTPGSVGDRLPRLIDGRFEKLSEVPIAQGGYGSVYKVKDTHTGQFLALKCPITKASKDAEAKREVHVLVRLGNHANVSGLQYTCMREDPQVGHVPLIFLQWAHGGALEQWISTEAAASIYCSSPKRSCARILDIAVQICRGLQHAHEQGIIHAVPLPPLHSTPLLHHPRAQPQCSSSYSQDFCLQDVKPKNILVVQEYLPANGFLHVRLTDFGISKFKGGADDVDVGESVAYGTGGYRSPEQEGHSDVAKPSDVWSLAVTVFRMLARAAWEPASKLAREVHDDCKSAEHQERYLAWLGLENAHQEQIMDLIGKCLSIDPASRPSVGHCNTSLEAAFDTARTSARMSQRSFVPQEFSLVNETRLQAYYHDYILEKFEKAGEYYELVTKLEQSAKSFREFAAFVERFR